MIVYTDHITRLMADVVRRVPDLGHIDVTRVLVFARFGRTGADGAFATCHALRIPSSEPAYYFWRDRRTGRMTRRSQWFVTRSPQVTVGPNEIDYLISFCLPRFCDQTVRRARKQRWYPESEPWMAKLDTIVHELYHIDPSGEGIRRVTTGDGRASGRMHSPDFLARVAGMVRQYLATNPDPALYEFLRDDFEGLVRRHGAVGGTAFRSFPSFPQRYVEVLHDHPVDVAPGVRLEELKVPAARAFYSCNDLHVRAFTRRSSRRVAVWPRELAA